MVDTARQPQATDTGTGAIGRTRWAIAEGYIPEGSHETVQHTRLDSRQAENALMTTIAFAD